MRPQAGNIPGMVARVGFGLVGGFLLFIDNNQADILQRRKNR